MCVCVCVCVCVCTYVCMYVRTCVYECVPARLMTVSLLCPRAAGKRGACTASQRTFHL